ncbi:hypothetical protein [Paenibacillus polymyxa]|uniref:Uncharacterized protein n=1 Tax=Paenibacillus polymyxa (strain SC2) TaxID=886882 RepID=A0A0D5ZC99_PAEPS|nr:hypothetical protein [Paenibacillus polymyxa]AKA44196.1 hypothetical protein PPSC2_06135 [Paenibacillus polymyxa SC2]WPQ58059.1 hypothetical protein SKN87_06275 [Paenibacillus polymyxa]
MILERDCIGYSIDRAIKVDSITVSNFEKIEMLSDCTNYQIHQYNWVDPIKYKEKLISKSTKSVSMIYFKNQLTIFLFGNSESNISYVESRLKRLFSVKFKKVDLYPKIINKLSSNNYKLKVINIQFVRVKDNLEKWVSIDAIGLSKNEFLKIINEENPQTISLYDELNKAYFSVDINSSLSFNDTTTISDIVGVLEYVSSCIS